jgi:hypothetical protein
MVGDPGQALRLVLIVLVVVACTLSVSALAERWRAVAELLPPSPSSCPTAVPILELQLEGSRFSGKSQAGKTFATSMAPDGGVSVNYQGVDLYGIVTIVGNALSRQLELSGSAVPGCRYILREQRSSAYRWTAATNLVGGVYRNCGDPPFSDYKFEVEGETLTGVPDQGKNLQSITLGLRSLKADGSGRITVKNPRTGVTVHFDFEAGIGPRKIRVGNDNNECRYLFEPK